MTDIIPEYSNIVAFRAQCRGMDNELFWQIVIDVMPEYIKIKNVHTKKAPSNSGIFSIRMILYKYRRYVVKYFEVGVIP